MSVVSVTIDLDEVPCYTAIHGLEPPPERSAHAIYRKALPRYEKLLSELQIPATFFVVGGDLQDQESAALVARLHRQGHEIANHSANHYYDLIRRERAVLRDEVAKGAEAIEKVTGTRPIGFRAPGYSVSDTLFEVLDELCVRYDSSVFPCPAYYGAKALAMAVIWAAGRRSRSILSNPLMLTSSAEPYRVGKPFWRRGNGLLELPIAVTRGWLGRLPYIGTSLVMAGAAGAACLSHLMLDKSFINIELHGIDLADVDQDDLAILRGREPALRHSFHDKQQALRAAVELLRENGYQFVTLAKFAATTPKYPYDL
jgi:peptidoglycan/xylan/chitin deacetylase (PgdA/CDA1 family)